MVFLRTATPRSINLQSKFIYALQSSVFQPLIKSLHDFICRDVVALMIVAANDAMPRFYFRKNKLLGGFVINE